ncbi:MAG: zinc ribbon domain-containing protein [Coriobacteriia bacterium]|nr:zinc ribbon domain-containing protein [Coriobacteriia bacterium]
MLCPNCKETLDEEAIFCPQCGSRLPEDKEQAGFSQGELEDEQDRADDLEVTVNETTYLIPRNPTMDTTPARILKKPDQNRASGLDLQDGSFNANSKSAREIQDSSPTLDTKEELAQNRINQADSELAQRLAAELAQEKLRTISDLSSQDAAQQVRTTEAPPAIHASFPDASDHSVDYKYVDVPKTELLTHFTKVRKRPTMLRVFSRILIVFGLSVIITALSIYLYANYFS